MSRHTARAALSAALLTAAAPAALAQEAVGEDDIEEIEEIIVTGTRIATTLKETGRSVSVITGADIETRQARFLFDALNVAPGLQLTRSGSFGALSSISLRGLPTEQTVTVIDGAVANDPGSFSNDFNFADFDASDVERVEVLRGAQSTLYGSNAIGGVINIITKDGSEGLDASGFFEGGSFQTFRGAASLSGGTEVVSGRISLAGTQTEGFSNAPVDGGDEDGFRNLSVSAKGRAQPIDDLTLTATVRLSDTANEIDGGANTDDPDNEAETQTLTTAVFADHTILDGMLENRVGVTFLRSDRLNTDGGATSFDAIGRRISAEYQGTFKPFDQLTFAYGAEYENQLSDIQVGFGSIGEIRTASGFGIFQFKPHERITLSAGARHDANDAFANATTTTGSGAIVIPFIETILRGSAGTGFRAPSVSEAASSPGLRPEESFGWDIGLSRSFLDDRVTTQATYFRQTITDQIAFNLAAFFADGTISFANLDLFETEGVEFFMRAKPIERLDWTVTYTFIDATDVTGDFAALNQPDHRFVTTVDWRPIDRLRLGATVTFNGREPDSGGQTLESFTLLDLRFGFDLTERWELFGRIENATDRIYQDNFGFQTQRVSGFGGIRVSL